MAVNTINIPAAISPADIYRANAANSVGKTEDLPQGSASFGSIFTNLVKQADEQYQVADAGTQSLLAGETDNLAQVMIDATKAEMSLNMVIQVRNKVLDAYNEIMRMSL